MKKLCLSAALFFVFSAMTLASPSGLSVKVGGGPSYFSVGELNSVLTDAALYYRAISETVSGELGAFHVGADLFAEALYQISPRIAVGLGAGFSCAQKQGSIHREYPGFDGTVQVDEIWTPKISVLPVTLSGYYALPLNAKWSIVLGAGLGYYHIRFEMDKDLQETRPSGGSTYDWVYRASRGTFGFQGSAALEMDISSLISIFASLRFRMASASDFVGTKETAWTDWTGSGEETDENQAFWIRTYTYDSIGYINLTFCDADSEPSSGGPYSNVHRGKIDISGATLGFGARIKF